MSNTHDQIRENNAAWWAAHPNLRAEIRWDAASLARSVVHWHHNVESSQRHGTLKAVDSDRFFLRQYAISATRAWLLEAQTELETYAADDPHWRGYGHTDVECLIRNLQISLDDFEWNTAHNKEQP